MSTPLPPPAFMVPVGPALTLAVVSLAVVALAWVGRRRRPGSGPWGAVMAVAALPALAVLLLALWIAGRTLLGIWMKQPVL